MAIATVNPATGQTLKTFPALSQSEIDAKLQLAAETFRTYRLTSIESRAEMMSLAAQILDDAKVHLGKLMTGEMGKPLKAAVAEAEKCAWVCRYYAENAKTHLADQNIETNAKKVLCVSNHLVQFSRSCPGIFHSGKYSALRRRP